MKRLILSLLLTLLLLTFTGCMKQVKTTEEETEAIAEYMAGLLLKYDSNYDKTLIDINDKAADVDDNTGTQTADRNEHDSDTSSSSDKTLPDNADKKDKKEDNVNTQQVSLSELIGLKDFDITYSGYEIAKFYPEKTDGTYFSVQADNGKQLLVVKFNIKNKSDKAKQINLSEAEIKYQLNIAGSKNYIPWITLLDNDMQYIDTTIETGKATEAVLIYQISKDTDPNKENVKLVVSKAEKEIAIPIK